MKNLLSFFRFSALLLLLCIGLYIGIAGWVGATLQQETVEVKTSVKNDTSSQSYEHGGVTFKTKEDLEKLLRQENASGWFPWLLNFPIPLLLLGTIGFGIIGGVGGIVKKFVYDKKDSNIIPIVAEPVFAGFIGAMLYFLSFIIPAIFTTGENPMRPEPLIGIAFLAGVFSKQTYEWLEKNIIKKIFKE